MRESSHSPLPRIVDALKLADAGASLRGSCDLNAMSRLDLDRTRPAGQLIAELEFSRDLQGRRFASGRFSASLPRVCQRCLESMTEDIAGSVLWALARDQDEAADLDAVFEAVILVDAHFKLWDALEDELILTQALAPVHENLPDCDPVSGGPSSEMKPDAPDAQPSPFSVLREIKRT